MTSKQILALSACLTSGLAVAQSQPASDPVASQGTSSPAASTPSGRMNSGKQTYTGLLLDASCGNLSAAGMGGASTMGAASTTGSAAGGVDTLAARSTTGDGVNSSATSGSATPGSATVGSVSAGSGTTTGAATGEAGMPVGTARSVGRNGKYRTDNRSATSGARSTTDTNSAANPGATMPQASDGSYDPKTGTPKGTMSDMKGQTMAGMSASDQGRGRSGETAMRDMSQGSMQMANAPIGCNASRTTTKFAVWSNGQVMKLDDMSNQNLIQQASSNQNMQKALSRGEATTVTVSGSMAENGMFHVNTIRRGK